jgi:hypothetical protein
LIGARNDNCLSLSHTDGPQIGRVRQGSRLFAQRMQVLPAQTRAKVLFGPASSVAAAVEAATLHNKMPMTIPMMPPDSQPAA